MAETYPSTPAPIRPISVEQEFKTLVSQFESGKEFRRKIWSYPLRTITLNYRTRQTNTAVLWNFYNARSGMFEPFWLVMPEVLSHTNEYVDKGNNSTTAFDLPAVASSNVVVYISGTPANVTISVGTGQAAADRITFATAPGNNTTITVDFYGKQRFYGRFAEDKYSKEQFEYKLYHSGLTIREIKV